MDQAICRTYNPDVPELNGCCFALVLVLHMFDTHGNPELDASNRRSRIKVVLIGAIGSLLIGAILFFTIFAVRYGQNPFGVMFGGRQENKYAGKLAYDKGSNTFVGVIKSEGYSVRKGGTVFYIERAGGMLIEVRKDLIEVREPSK